jgi:lipoprotein-anchoring transpeptidase ErfK/SrfK
MKAKSVGLSALTAILAVTFVMGTATPAGAAQGAATQPVGSILAGLLDALRGRGGAPAPMSSTPVPPAGAAAQTTTPTPPPAQTPTPQSQAVAAPPGPASPLVIEQHLAGLRYDVGPVDGNMDSSTFHAVMAFQKVHGMSRTGDLNEQTTAAIMAETGTPPPLVPNSDVNKVEIDLTRQVLFLYENGSLSKILPVSSGTAETPTPTGSYRIYRQATGWETSPLGRLYNSQYFVGGYAIHGSLSVPNHPASHGCVRLPMNAAEWFPDHVGIGTPVYVLGG